MLDKILDSVLKAPLAKVNGAISGKKTYLAAAVILLPALAGLIQEVLENGISVGSLLALAKSDYIKQIGEGLAIIGFRAAINK